MYNRNWSRKELTPMKLGVFCEYYAKMALTSYGMNIYTSEVDDHGIDFVAETSKGFLKFQVKAARRTQYVFVHEKDFDISDTSLYLVLILLVDGSDPDLYLIPADAWQHREDKLFVYHAYQVPEYGINISNKNMPKLENFRIENMISSLM